MHLLRIAALGLLASLVSQQALCAYKVERVVGGLNQPMFVTQAPNDNSSLYIVERNDGGSQLGRIRRFNLHTQSLSTFLDLTGGITSDGGVLSMAFSPNYQANGKFYVTSNINGSNRLDEYQLVSGVPQFQRRLLEYSNLDNVFHTINQPHFRPNGNSNELFVTTGDGGTQADSPNFDPELIESPTSIYGKVLRIDLNANFNVPASDATHAGVDAVALGIRNPFRSSFDRQTGDFYFGDVGFNMAEEVNFAPASHFANHANAPLDYGWTSREGTIATVPEPPGGPGSPGDLNPIFDYAHSGQPLPHTSPFSGQSITGGYVYRGPVPELQGRYFFSDFTNGNVYSGLFNAATPSANYNGTNLTNVQDHTVAFETDIGGGANIRNVTSFGEDNAGNLYIVKFGNGFFPPLGQGEIFRIVPNSGLNVVVNRDTGAITLANNTPGIVNFTSLAINSAFGAIDPAALTPITGHYDSTGDRSVDNNNPWQVTSAAGNHLQFTESTTGDAGSLAVGQQITLSLADGWLQSPVEDFVVSLLVNGAPVNAAVTYVGNGGQVFGRSDLDFDGDLTIDDWSIFLNGSYANLSGLSRAEAYARGDLDGDGDNDYADFQRFKSDFDAVNGAGAFEAMAGVVPEPSGALMALTSIALALRVRCRDRR